MDYVRLVKRAEYVNVAVEKKAFKKKAFIFQYALKDTDNQLRFGITASRKVGGAVERNRAKRRLREIIRLELKEITWKHKSVDCVLIARHNVLKAPFQELLKELKNCLDKLSEICGNAE